MVREAITHLQKIQFGCFDDEGMIVIQHQIEVASDIDMKKYKRVDRSTSRSY